MPVIPPTRSEPYVPPDQIMREVEPGEPAAHASRSERAMIWLVVLMLFLVFAAAVIFPHTPLSGE